MPQLMTRAPPKPRARPRAVEHLIQPRRRQRQPAPRALQNNETRLRHRLGGTLELEILAQRREEPAGDRHDPLTAALPTRDVHTSLADAHVAQPQAEHLAAAQPPSSIASTTARSR